MQPISDACVVGPISRFETVARPLSSVSGSIGFARRATLDRRTGVGLLRAARRQATLDRRLNHPSRARRRAASVLGDPDIPHTYTFIPDIGENLRLGESDEALGRIWHLPSPEMRTTRDVVALVYQAAGTKPRLMITPAWQMRALRLVNRTVREINTMRYE
jgi:hypothetical protein